MNNTIDLGVTSTMGLINTVNAVSVGGVTEILSTVAAVCSFAYVAVKIALILIKHFKEKHGKDCECVNEIKDILDKGE